MTIGILCHELEEVESASLISAVERAGHVAVAFTLEQIKFRYERGLLHASTDEIESLRTLDLIISRAKIAHQQGLHDYERYELLCQLGLNVTDNASSFLAAESKLLTQALLVNAGLPVLPTDVCENASQISASVKRFGDSVVKASFGFGGEAVERLRCNEDWLQVHKLLDRFGQVLVQPYVAHSQGDFRVTTLDDQVLFVARRIGNEKTWKSNVSLGADVVVLEQAPAELEQLGRGAAGALGLFMAGVDILPFEGGYIVLEVNNCPGWTDLAEPKMKMIADRIIERALGRSRT